MNSTMEKIPLHPHHCDACIYLGQGSPAKEGIPDVYYCANPEEHDEESIVVRWNKERWFCASLSVSTLQRPDSVFRQTNVYFQPFQFGLEQAQKRNLLQQE